MDSQAVEMSTTSTDFEDIRSQGAIANKRLSQASQVRQILDLQRVQYGNAMDPFTCPADSAKASQTWCLLAEALRVARNKLKPGQWNVSQVAPGPKRAKPGRVVDVESVVKSLAAPPKSDHG